MTLTLEDIESYIEDVPQAYWINDQEFFELLTLAKRPPPYTAIFCVMYDNHTYKDLQAKTPEDAIEEWEELFTPYKSGIGGDPSLCPVVFLDAAGAECLPRVGEMLHTPRDQKAVAEWIRAVTTALETP
jgi:hypothetical protein